MDRYSIYIHLPFCKKKCPYCDFHSTETLDIPIKEYTESLFLEWRQRRRFVSDRELLSIYIGGGTPSLWPSPDLVELLRGFPDLEGVEVTVEVNPGDGADEWFQHLTDVGVNRFSIGVQAFDDTRLKWLGRRHDLSAAKKAIMGAERSCAKSVGVDLIYGTPGQTESGLLEEIKMAADLGVDHFSAYELTVSEGTPLEKRVTKGDVVLPGDDEMADLWCLLGESLGQYDYDRYEVSNFSKPGHRCRHNVHYWRGGVYVGLGAGAHGFLHGPEGSLHRYSNSHIISQYQEFLSAHRILVRQGGIGSDGTMETLDPLTHAREKVMLGLRTTDGLIFEKVFEDLSPDVRILWLKLLEAAQVEGLVSLDDQGAIPTEKGMLQADNLASRFF